MDFHRIDRNISSGYLRAITINASSYTSHDSISFYQGQSDIKSWQREQRRGIPCPLNSEHLIASSVIPMLFPPVKMMVEFLGDGSIHQETPLSPAIHLGAEKILIIGVEKPEAPHPVYQHESIPQQHPYCGAFTRHYFCLQPKIGP